MPNKFPSLPFELGRSGKQWVSKTRKSGAGSFKKHGKRSEKKEK